MAATAEHTSALSRLGQARDVAARLSLRRRELEQEEAQIMGRLRQREAAESDQGELVRDAESLITAAVPVSAPALPARARLADVRGLIAQLQKAEREQLEVLQTLSREASREIITGAEGDGWRKAARKLAKAVSELAAADAEIFEVQKELQRRLPDPDALWLVRFPPGPLASFEPGDVAALATRFAEWLLEVDRHYNGTRPPAGPGRR